MRSVVVVLPASTWAMMPMLRISDSGVLRAISAGSCDEKGQARNCAQKGARTSKKRARIRDGYLEAPPQNPAGVRGGGHVMSDMLLSTAAGGRGFMNLAGT